MSNFTAEILLTDEEKAVVRAIAEGISSVNIVAEAQRIFRKYAKPRFSEGKKSVEIDFLSEVFNQVPDLALRAQYRKKILAQS